MRGTDLQVQLDKRQEALDEHVGALAAARILDAQVAGQAAVLPPSKLTVGHQSQQAAGQREQDGDHSRGYLSRRTVLCRLAGSNNSQDTLAGFVR